MDEDKNKTEEVVSKKEEVKEEVKKTDYVNLAEFQKVNLKLGQILSAEKVPDTDKLLKLSVDMGEGAPRQIISGISLYFPDPSVLIGKKCMFVANLEPRVIRGYESQGMILALSNAEGKFSLITSLEDMPTGTSAK